MIHASGPTRDGLYSAEICGCRGYCVSHPDPLAAVLLAIVAARRGRDAMWSEVERIMQESEQ